jgi:cold shock CspA family protein
LTNIYFHSTGLRDISFLDLQIGDRVSFIRTQNERGPCALEIRRLPAEVQGVNPA